jgi:hypothetical protein
MSDFYQSRTPKARKNHRCCECAGKIKIGEVYFRHSGVWEGDFFTYKNCDDCEHLRAELNEELDTEDQIGFGELCGYCMETGGFDYLRCLQIQIKRGVLAAPSPVGFHQEMGTDGLMK